MRSPRSRRRIVSTPPSRTSTSPPIIAASDAPRKRRTLCDDEATNRGGQRNEFLNIGTKGDVRFTTAIASGRSFAHNNISNVKMTSRKIAFSCCPGIPSGSSVPPIFWRSRILGVIESADNIVVLCRNWEVIVQFANDKARPGNHPETALGFPEGSNSRHEVQSHRPF
jgi:hypothetical protein